MTESVRRLALWLQARPLLTDAMLAGALAALAWSGLAAALARDPGRLGGAAVVAAIVLIGVQTLTLTLRRVAPMGVYAVVGGATVANAWLGYPTTIAGLAVLIALYTVAAHAPLRDAVVAGAIYLAGMTLSLLGAYRSFGGAPDEFVRELVINVLLLVMAWVVGVTIRTRRAYVESLEQRAALLEREQGEHARLAVAIERARLARELHDVVAHSVSVMVVQSAAAERLIESDPSRAREALATVADTGRQALDEMRRALGVLRGEDGGELAPQPGVLDLGVLALQMSEAGLPVELSVQGAERPLPGSVAVSAYRIVQEALTNSLKHAGPARARVIVRYLPDCLELQVTDNGAGTRATAAGGHGLIGMRERVQLFGGELEAGPRPEGGFGVRARLPVGAD